MKTVVLRNIHLSDFLIIFISIVVIIQGSCSSPSNPGQHSSNKFLGQVVSDVAFAVLKPDGSVWTWGFNGCGTLGNGTTNSNIFPVRVLNLNNIISIDLYGGMGAAADREGNIWYWGFFIASNLGAEHLIVKEPVKISKLTGVVSLDMGLVYIYLLKNDGTVWYVKFDLCSPREFLQPVQIQGITNICKISNGIGLSREGTLHVLTNEEKTNGGMIEGICDVVDFSNSHGPRIVALKKDGTVWAWGRNSNGELGNGSLEDSEVPVRVLNLTDVAAVSANYVFNLALNKYGTVWFWGFVKKVGDKNIGQKIPVRIENLDNVSLIYASSTSIVMRKDGSYWTFNSEDRIPSRVPFQ